MLTADIVENLLKEKDLEIRELHDTKCNLIVIARDTDINVNNLKVQLSEKCKKIEEIEQRMAKLQKVCVVCLYAYVVLFQFIP